MVRLRFQRLGRRHRPFYRLNAIDKRTRRNGVVIEQLGWFDPVATDPEKQVSFNEERIKHWLEHGAQPSETVADMLAARDLLPEKMKARWEADRETARNRVEARKAVSTAEAAVTAIGELAGDTGASVANHVSEAESALKDAKSAAGNGNITAAGEAAAKAEAALAAAKKADEDHKAAEAKKAEEAAAAEAAEADSGEGEEAAAE